MNSRGIAVPANFSSSPGKKSEVENLLRLARKVKGSSSSRRSFESLAWSAFCLLRIPHCNFQPLRKLPNPFALRLQGANVIFCLIPLLSGCAAAQLQTNSVSTDHEIACCDLFAYTLKNQTMFVQICEEGVGGEKGEKNPKHLSCLQSINWTTCCRTLQGALVLSPGLLSI